MFYEGLEKTDLAAILVTLTKDIGEEYVQLIIAKNPPNAVKRQVDWLHMMCCTKHTEGAVVTCDYYEEEVLDEGWTKYDHRAWMVFWQTLTSTKSVQRLQELIYAVSSIVRDIQMSTDRNSGLAELLDKLHNQNPRLLMPTPPQTAPVPAEPSEVADDLIGSALSPEE